MTASSLTILLLTTISASCQASSPFIKFISGPEEVADLGQSSSLVCKVENGNDYPIIWMKKIGENSSPLSTGKNLIIENPRLNLTYVSVNNEIVITLKIDKIVEEDDAVYICQVKSGINDMITKRVKLNVKTPVKILDSSTTELTVVEGQSASMECDTSGYPAPVVEWSRTDGRVMFNRQTTATGANLVLSSVHRSDEGEYRCVASNSVGPAQNITTNLLVRFPPQISVPRPRLQQALGYDVRLSCLVESFPTSALDWQKDGELIKNDNHFYIAHFNKGAASTLTTLQIYGLVEEDYGTYQCLANNKHGNDTQTVELIKTKIPIPEAAFGGSLQQHSSILAILSSLATVFSISVLVI